MIKTFSDQSAKLPVTPNPLAFSCRITDKYRFNRSQRRRIDLIFFKLQQPPVGENPKSNIWFIHNLWQRIYRQNLGFRGSAFERPSISFKVEPTIRLDRVVKLSPVNRSTQSEPPESSRSSFRFVYEKAVSGKTSEAGVPGKSGQTGSLGLSQFATMRQWVQSWVFLKIPFGLAYPQTAGYLRPGGTPSGFGPASLITFEAISPGNMVFRQKYPGAVNPNQPGSRTTTRPDSVFSAWPYRTGLQLTIAADHLLTSHHSHHIETVLNRGQHLNLHYNQQFLKTDNPVFLSQDSLNFHTQKHFLSGLSRKFFHNTVTRVVMGVIPHENRRESWDEPSGITAEQPEPGKPTRELRVRDILQTQRNVTPGSPATERLSVIRPLTFRSNISVDIRPDQPERPEPEYPIREIRDRETLLQDQKQQTTGPTLRERVVSIAKPLTLITQSKVRSRSDQTGFILQRFQISATSYRLNDRNPWKAAVPGAANRPGRFLPVATLIHSAPLKSSQQMASMGNGLANPQGFERQFNQGLATPERILRHTEVARDADQTLPPQKSEIPPAGTGILGGDPALQKRSVVTTTEMERITEVIFQKLERKIAIEKDRRGLF